MSFEGEVRGDEVCFAVWLGGGSLVGDGVSEDVGERYSRRDMTRPISKRTASYKITRLAQARSNLIPDRIFPSLSGSTDFGPLVTAACNLPNDGMWYISICKV